jgi:hypothetical protein
MANPNAAIITWVDPVNRTDGTPIAPDSFTIQIYDSLSATPATPIGTVASGVQTFTTAVLAAGTHEFALTATDSEGNISVATAPISFVVTTALAAPNPPTSPAVVGTTV